MCHRMPLQRTICKLHRESHHIGLLGTHRLQSPVLLGKIHPCQESNRHQRQNHTHNTQRICHRISQRNGRIVLSHQIGVRLLRRTKTGSIRNSTRHHTHHRSHRCSGHQVYNIGRHSTQRNHSRCTGHHPESALLKRREESRPHLQTDRKYEEYQTKLLDKVQRILIDRHSEMTSHNTHEQDPGNTYRNTSNLDLTQHYTARNDQRQHEHRMGNSAAHK